MKAKLILWFVSTESLVDFLAKAIHLETGLHIDVYSAQSYRMVTIPDVSGYLLENGQLRFTAGSKGFVIHAPSVLRQEIKFYEVEE